MCVCVCVGGGGVISMRICVYICACACAGMWVYTRMLFCVCGTKRAYACKVEVCTIVLGADGCLTYRKAQTFRLLEHGVRTSMWMFIFSGLSAGSLSTPCWNRRSTPRTYTISDATNAAKNPNVMRATNPPVDELDWHSSSTLGKKSSSRK